MNRFVKVLLAALVCVVGVVCMNLSASADDSGTAGDGITWTYSDGTLIISGTGEMTSYSSGGAPWYSSYKDSITTVVIEEGVTQIGSFAFYKCTSLVNVTLPDSLLSMKDYSFGYCSSLTSITIPNSVTSIGTYAFHSCTSLTSITIPNNVTSIGNYTFYNCTSLTSVTIPDSVTSIKYEPFYNCKSLTSIIIPGSVTEIGESAFSGCSALTSAHYLGAKSSVTIYSWNSTLTSVLHYMTQVDARAATCEEVGYSRECYVCDDDDCDVVIYKDDNGNYVATNTSDESIVIPLHSGNDNTTYTSDGNGTHYLICSVCEKTIANSVENCEDCYGDYINDESEGNHYQECSKCGYKYYSNHEYDDGSFSYDESSHWQECKYCSYTTESEEHVYSSYNSTFMNDENLYIISAACDTCEYNLTYAFTAELSSTEIEYGNDDPSVIITTYAYDWDFGIEKAIDCSLTYDVVYSNNTALTTEAVATITFTGEYANCSSITLYYSIVCTEHNENTNETYTSNNNGTHSIYCSVCDEEIEDTRANCEECELNYLDNSDGETHTISCSVCEYEISDSTAHTYTYTQDEDTIGTHTKSCEYCTYTTTEDCTASSDEWTTDSTAHYKTCSVCEGYAEYEEHDTNDYYTTATQHAKSCSVCGYYDSLEDHTEAYTDNNDGTHTICCSVCDYTISSSDSHTYTYTQDTTGSHTKACTYCTYTTTEDCTASSDEWTTDSAAHYKTCSVCNGYAEYEDHDTSDYYTTDTQHAQSCSVCGYYDSLEDHTEAYTDNNDGTHTVYCSVCDYTISSSTAHTYTYTQDEGTIGTHTKSCTYCTYTTTESCTANSETWTTDSTAHYKTCSICNGYAEYATHDTDSYYTTDTQHAQSCSVCGYYDSLEDHSSTNAPTSYGDTYHTYTCDACGKEYDVEHTYTTNVTDPTCTTEGYTTYKCNDCDYTCVGDNTDAKGHALTATSAIASTCTEKGNSAYWYCSTCTKYFDSEDCDNEISEGDWVLELDSDNHNYTTEVTDPTCTEQGYTTYTCEWCSNTYDSDYEDANGHSYTTETCTNGTTIATCSVCDDMVVTVAESDDTDDFKVVLKESITITDDLASVGYTDEDSVKSALIEYLVQASGVEVIEGSNAVIYDVVLLFREDNGPWQIATVDNFPSEGITVVLEYPEGTDADSYNFYVAHMFAYNSDTLGTTAGEFEYPTVTKTANGIQVTLTGLSPVIISWEEIVEESTTDTSTTTDTTTSSSIDWVYYLITKSSTTAEDVSTGSGMTATESASTSAIAVVSLVGVAYAVMMARKRK